MSLCPLDVPFIVHPGSQEVSVWKPSLCTSAALYMGAASRLSIYVSSLFVRLFCSFYSGITNAWVLRDRLTSNVLSCFLSHAHRAFSFYSDFFSLILLSHRIGYSDMHLIASYVNRTWNPSLFLLFSLTVCAHANVVYNDCLVMPVSLVSSSLITSNDSISWFISCFCRIVIRY